MSGRDGNLNPGDGDDEGDASLPEDIFEDIEAESEEESSKNSHEERDEDSYDGLKDYQSLNRSELKEYGLEKLGKRAGKDYDTENYDALNQFEKFHRYLEEEEAFDEIKGSVSSMYSNIINLSSIEVGDPDEVASISMEIAIADELDDKDPLTEQEIRRRLEEFNEDYLG